MNDTSGFTHPRRSPAGLWQRTAGVPMSGVSGRPTDRFRAVLSGASGPNKRPTGLMWRRGRKAGDVPVHHPIDKWDRMIWVRPERLTQPPEGKAAAKRRLIKLAGRHLVSEPVRAAWITSPHVPDEAHRFGAGWVLSRTEVETSPSFWHRAPVSQEGRGSSQLARRPPVRRNVVTPHLD